MNRRGLSVADRRWLSTARRSALVQSTHARRRTAILAGPPYQAYDPVVSCPCSVSIRRLVLVLVVAASAVAALPARGQDPHRQHDHAAGLPPVTLPAGSIVTEADVRFMQGMIAHHAQAVVMSRMAEAREASPRVLKLARKIDFAQAGEIALMQDWLRAYDQFVPDTASWRGMTMPGMLTTAQLALMEASRGSLFDRLFLELMIGHHQGALLMVSDLLKSPRAAQEVDINVFANDVETTQTAEIGLMRQMLLDR